MRHAIALVREHWSAIERVADELLEHGELDGAGINALSPGCLTRHGDFGLELRPPANGGANPRAG
jgi:hypothetical protein